MKKRAKTLQQRLKWCMAEGNLVLSDLARWLARPVPTVKGWVDKGRQPGGGPIDQQHVMALLGLLETLIRKKKGFPVPRLGPQERIAHIAKIRQAMMTATLSD